MVGTAYDTLENGWKERLTVLFTGQKDPARLDEEQQLRIKQMLYTINNEYHATEVKESQGSSVREAKANLRFETEYNALKKELVEQRIDDFFDALDGVDPREAIPIADSLSKQEKTDLKITRGKIGRLQDADSKNSDVRKFMADYLSQEQSAAIIRSLPRSGKYVNSDAALPQEFIDLAKDVAHQGRMHKLLREPKNKQRGFCTTATDVVSGLSEVGMPVPGPLQGITGLLCKVDAWHKLAKIVNPQSDVKGTIDAAFNRLTSREEREQLVGVLRDRVVPTGANGAIESIVSKFSGAFETAKSRMPAKAMEAFIIVNSFASGKDVGELANKVPAAAAAKIKSSLVRGG